MHAGVAPSWKLLRPSIFCARARLRPTSFAAGKNRGGRPTAVAVAAVKTWGREGGGEGSGSCRPGFGSIDRGSVVAAPAGSCVAEPLFSALLLS